MSQKFQNLKTILAAARVAERASEKQFSNKNSNKSSTFSKLLQKSQRQTSCCIGTDTFLPFLVSFGLWLPELQFLDRPHRCPDIRAIFVEYPQMWVWPQVPLGGPSPSVPLRCHPHARPGRPLPQHHKKTQGGGVKREGGVGGKGLWLEGRVLQLPWGGDPPKNSWGQTHTSGLSILGPC